MVNRREYITRGPMYLFSEIMVNRGGYLAILDVKGDEICAEFWNMKGYLIKPVPNKALAEPVIRVTPRCGY